MRKIKLSHTMRPLAGAAFALLLLGAGTSALADPVVSTVPWVASNPLIPHVIFNGEATRLKGTASDTDAGTLQYTWDFGDGSPVVAGTVTNQYVVEATHTYTGVTGTVFTATLTVQNTGTGASDSNNYFVQVQDKNLDSEVNVAIDEGLWYLHKSMTRFDITGLPGGYWTGVTGNLKSSSNGQNVSAFLVNGHLSNGPASNPYVETVQRGLRRMFSLLNITSGIPASETNPEGTFDPDANGNNCAVFDSEAFYQSGMVIDAIVSTGLQNEVVDVAPFTTTNCSGTGQTNNGSWTYADVVQDYIDYLSWCQYDGVQGGGWRYSCEAFPDGSAVQWAAVGLIAAERNFGAIVPQPVKDHLVTWTDFAHNLPTGRSGYTAATSYPWGDFATTPSGTVQMVYNGQGRGNPIWDTSETYLRNTWCNLGTSATQNIKNYYYGLFSFTKSMLLHDSNGDAVSEPIDCFGSARDVDWYAGEAGQPSSCSVSEPCNGVARSLVNDQNSSGYWSGRNFTGSQNPYSTGWAIVMLNRTVFSSGLPVAVAQATPNPAVAGQTVVLDGSSSFHQDASRSIDSWEWDLDNDGVFDATGPTVSTSFGAIGNYPVTLRVTDDATPEASDNTVITVIINVPPLAPTADADGPYVFCPQAQPWFLDGSGSVNPDEGLSEPGQPGDTIQSYEWELDGDNAFDDAAGVQPDVTAFFSAMGVGDYLVQLKVTDTTATSFPSSNFGDLSDTDAAQVSVKDAADAACSCIDNLAARPKSGKVQLTWTDTGADHYNVYRSTTSGGPFSLIASTTSTYSTYLDEGLTNGTTYYYVVREAALNGDELCQSNEASATPVARVRRR